jgi:type IV secretion system protein VirB4
MLHLAEFRKKAAGLADLLGWAALVDDGVVLCKDGSLLAGWFYEGPDMIAASDAVRNGLTARVNAALARLGSGWSSWHEAIRLPATEYPEPARSYFPDRVTRWIDDERRQAYRAEGRHYETRAALIVQYLPPLAQKSKAVDLLYAGGEKTEKAKLGDRILAGFKKDIADLEDAIGDTLRLERLSSSVTHDRFGNAHLRDDLVNLLHLTLTGDPGGIEIPPFGAYLDAVISGREFWAGDFPVYGEESLAMVSIEGFPSASRPGLLEFLDELPFSYRWSTRFIYLDTVDAETQLNKYRRAWKQKQRGFFAQVFKTTGGRLDQDAVEMANATDAALSEAKSGMVRYGFYSSVVVIRHADRAELTERARLVLKLIRAAGFEARIETINSVEAFLGSLPGHVYPNVRRPIIHTLNLADLLPLSSVWPGRATCPCPFYDAASPPLLYAATEGATPFRLNLHQGDVGHTLIFGPTGAGKSFLLNVLAAQFRRYRGASIVAFDKGNSMLALVEAAGGRHCDVGADQGGPAFAPLAYLDGPEDLAWAQDWLETCYRIQTDTAPTPEQRSEIYRALVLMQKAPRGMRSLTDFTHTVQDKAIRQALEPYTNAYGHILDAREDGTANAAFTVYEMQDLMNLGDRVVVPVLLHLFRRFEQSLKGQPALLSLDEAWILLGHPLFREKIREWLKVLRKANCCVVIATQSLSDAFRSGIFDVLVESCPTKILLPNEEALKQGTKDNPGPLDLYRMFGLDDVEIALIQGALYKRHYYYMSPEGRRLFELAPGPITRAFAGVSDKEDVARVQSLVRQFGDHWPEAWLRYKGVALPNELPRAGRDRPITGIPA